MFIKNFTFTIKIKKYILLQHKCMVALLKQNMQSLDLTVLGGKLFVGL